MPEDSDKNEPHVEIDLAQDATSVWLTVVIPKQAKDAVVAAWLRRVSRAFAATEGGDEDRMHATLETQVRGFENATHLKFVWERSLPGWNPRYAQLLSDQLALDQPIQTLN